MESKIENKAEDKTEDQIKDKTEEKEKKNLEKKKNTTKGKGSFRWQFFMTCLFLFGMLLLCAGLYTAWTTYHDSDLIEPFVCSYEESDLHAREVSAAFENIISRAEELSINDNSFSPGNINYGYCVSRKKHDEEIIHTNIQTNKQTVLDSNIRSLLSLKDPGIEYEDFSGADDTSVYSDCYWWDVESDPEIIYKGYYASRVAVPAAALKARNVFKVGICYSNGILQEREQSWNGYVSFLYLMTGILLFGGILSLYSGIQLLLYGKLPRKFQNCYMEVPLFLVIFSLMALHFCYERKITFLSIQRKLPLFFAQDHMEMLETSAGTVQLLLYLIAGTFILTGLFSILFLGFHMMVFKVKKHGTGMVFFFYVLYKNHKKHAETYLWLKEFFGKMKHPLRFIAEKVIKTWKFFWGLFTGRSIQGNTIAERERKRTLFMATTAAACIFGITISYLNISQYRYEVCFFVCILLLTVFISVYLFGSMTNTVDYARLEQMIEKVYQGNYQEVKIKKSGISKWSVCFSDAEKLEQIGDGFQKAVEDQLHAERMKMELLTNVSHDLKTPLTSIISYVELLSMEEGLPAEAVDYIIILKKKAERLKTIISEVFELAKTTSGEIQIEKKEIDFYRLVVQTMGDMQDQIDASGLRIKENLTQKHVMIYSDGERLYRVLQNLLDNALKYSMKGTRIFLDLESTEGMLTFTIKNIAGYEMEFDAGDITERFVRGDKNRTTEGSGLGLSIAQGFTIACGGTFSVIIDGDMFKVMMQFPVIEPSEKRELEI